MPTVQRIKVEWEVAEFSCYLKETPTLLREIRFLAGGNGIWTATPVFPLQFLGTRPSQSLPKIFESLGLKTFRGTIISGSCNLPIRVYYV